MRYIGFIFALCLSIQAIASNTITLSSVSGTPQTEVEVVVSLDNTDAITALELNIPLGEYFTYVDGSTVLASSRSNGHLLTATQVQQELRICVYSLNLSALQGNSGELLSFRLKLGNEPAAYTLTPSVILSDTRGQSLDSHVQSGQVSILAPKLEILNPQIDYGHIPIRETYTQDLQLYNAGNLPLIIENIVVNDPAFTPAQTALTIEVGEVAYTTIHYAPTVRGAIQKEVVVTSNASNGKQIGTIVADPFSVNELHVVGGSGIADNAVTISLKMNNMEPIVGVQCTFVLPEQLEYIAGSLIASSSRSNGHQAMASVKKFVEKENQWYDSKGDTLVLMLYSMANQPLNGDDGEIATFQVRLNGNSGSYALTPRDVVLTNATAENMVSATSEGWVEVQSPQFSGDDYLSFGDWSITDDIVANYVVRNYGDASLEIERVTFLAQGYRVVSTMPLQINPWEESTMQIAYDPAAEGDFSTTMNIYTNDPTTRMKAVAVSGHVYEPNTLSVDGERMQDGSYQLAISLDNYTNIVGVQYDIHWRSDMTTSQAAFTPTARLQNHTYAIMPIGQNTYRVLIYSLSNTPITGKEGELHQLLFTPQGDVDYCGDVLTIDNIVLSNANGTDKVSQSTVLHHLPTTQYSEQTITACDQYVYNNEVYQSSGTYIDTLQTVGGCDSIVTTYLTINHSEREEYYETACDEYYWDHNGETYYESGDYEYYTITEQGCERVEVLHLTINRSEREEYNVTACDQYEWHGETYYESGDYEYYTITEQGCERVEVLHLTINRSEREEYTATACDQYEWNGQVYTESGDYEYRTTTEQGCERLEVLHLTINRSEREEFEVSACDSYEWHGQVYTASGDYEYRTTTEQGCERVEILHLTINRSEREEFNTTSCDSYEWHGKVYTESGDYEYRTTTADGCERVEVLHLTINHPEYEEYYVTVCKSYEWHGEVYREAGDYTYETTTTHGCQRTEVLHLTLSDIEHEEFTVSTCEEYWWHDTQYTESGDYEYHTNTDEGCERVEILHLTINRSEYEEIEVSACDSYEWHGNTYYSSGTYEHYTTTKHGCERVEVLYLTINHSEYEEYWETACDSYEWHGKVYTESGDYEHYTTTEHGCERVEVLHLSINKSEREEYTATACNQYEWHGQVYTESGAYEYRTNTDAGCERLEVLHLTINRSEREEFNVSACESYEWHGNTYYDSGTYEHYTTTEHGCERVEILHLTIHHSEREEYYVTTCNQYEWHGQVYTEPGDYEYYTTTEYGCERVEVLHLSFSDREYEEYYETACDQYEWHGEVYTESGDYTFNTISSNGCERTEVLHLTINHSEREEYYENGCDVYEWHGNTYTESGDYEYRTTLENGCERVEVLHLTIYNSQYEEYWETACDKYLWWNGQYYYESGDYTYSYPLYDWGTGTCDRTEVLHLTINKRDTVHYYETACDEYWWDPYGQYYNTSGDYENYTTNEYGCERVEILHLTINYSEYEEYWETACDEFWWHDNQYTESGDYEYHTTTEQGCERVEVLHLTINHSQYEEYNITTCEQYEWHGEPYTESGDYEYRTTLENGCERVEVLHLTLSDSEREEYNITACDSYEWHGETYTESGDYEYRTTIEETTEKLYVGYDAQNDPIIGLVPPRGVSKFTVDGYITEEYGACFVGTGTPVDEEADNSDLRIFGAGCLFFDRMSGRNSCFFYDYREPFNIEFGNYYAKNLETSEYYFNEGNNVYEYSNTEYPLTLFYNDYGKIHKVQFFDNNNLLWADINAVIEGGVPMITIDYYNPDGSIYHTQQFTENLHAETKTITEQGCERVEVLHLTINSSEYEEYWETACDAYEWHGNTYTESGDYEYHTTTDQGCERVEVLHLTIYNSQYEEYWETACDEYWWQGNTYTESGDYTYSFVIADWGSGYCERTEVLHLTINKSEREEYWATACDEYYWDRDGNTYYDSGDYEHYTTTEHGCERVEILHLTINRSEYEDYWERACDQYEWHGEVYTASGDYEYRTTTADGCERVEVLHLTIYHSEYEDYWVTACDEYWWQGNTYTESGDYTYSFVKVDWGSGYCERTEVLHLTINHREREEYWATACDEYYWDRNGNIYYDSGDYEHYTTTEHGCERVEVLHLTINRSEREDYWENACDAYEWHGNTYTESGDYEYRTTLENGCERVEVLHLTINRSERGEYNVTACDQYEWHGEVYTESGTYEYHTTTEQGCERVEVLYLTISDREHEEYYETACDEFYWDHNGQTYYESGDYIFNTTATNGCERTEVLHLTINHSEHQDYYENACDAYEWHGETYTQSGNYEYRSTLENGCERVEVLHLTIYNSQYEEYWETACDEYYWNGEIYTESGEYTYSHPLYDWGTGTCDRTEVLHLTINKRDTVHYYETACDRYYWNNNGNEYYESGDYEYYTTNEYGCERVEILHLTINYSEHQDYYENACDAYEWHGETYTQSGNYEYRSTLENGCERVEVLHLTIYHSEYEDYWVTACDEYWWNNNQYTESGEYTYSYPLYNWGTGTCDRTEVLHLTINKRDTVHYYETACDEYWWDPYGLYYNTSGDYEYYTTNEHGCERLEVLHLTINRSEREEYNVTACDQYEWHGEVYTESGTYEYHTTTDQGCERVEVLYLTISDREHEEYYETACDEFYWDHNGQTYYESGDYIFNTTAANGCERTEVLHLTINHSEREEFWATACDEYFWDRDGNTHYDSGDYEYYTTTEHGCERVEVLHLTINRSEREEYWETACDSYEWYGQVYTASGDYEYRTTTEQGCERVEVLHLTINKSEREEYYETACDEYWWWRDGNTYYESGTYEYHTTTGDGCERTEVLHLTINKRDTVHYYETACDEYWWDPYGLYYNTSGNYEYYTTNEYGCERVEVLHLTINRSEREEYWETACDSYEWYGQVYTASGDYEYRTTTEQGCERVEVLHLSINKSEREEYYETACDSYEWNGVVFTESGDYTYTTTTEQGCERVEVLHLTINRSEREEYYETACDEFYWDRNGETYYESGDYTFNTTTEQGCERVEVLHLTINKSERVEETVTSCYCYEWNELIYTESGDYEFYTTTDQGCERIEVLHLTILPYATTESEELALCPSELPYEWYGQSLTEAGTYSATEQYAGMECDSVIHELTLNVYVQTLPAAVTLPIVRTGEAIDVTTPTAEIQAHIAAETWYAPNAEVAWYILENSDWAVLTTDPVKAGTKQVVVKYAVETDCGNVESDNMVIDVISTSVENTNSPSPISNCQKVLYEDHIYILRDGKIYSVMGQEL